MNNKARISSILTCANLDASISGFQSFELSELASVTEVDIPLPTNLRLGHLVEKIVSGLIKSSDNYSILYENIQILENKITIGEIDFILFNQHSKQTIHLELAYKFYLLDPNISSEIKNNWIGPNRRDSLKEKLDKLRNKQFPMLHHPAVQSKLDKLTNSTISQQLCFLVSLFVPYNYDHPLPAAYQKAVKGYYLSFEKFMSLDHSDTNYYLPPKKEWGIDPSEHTNWIAFDQIHTVVHQQIARQQATLCWQKHQDSYAAFFVVWW